MIDSKTIIKALMASVFSLVLIGCADDDEIQGNEQLLTLMPYSTPFSENGQSSDAKTRALPSNYQEYSEMYPQADNSYAKIAVYLAKKDGDTWNWDYKGNFTHTSGDAWSSTVHVDPNTDYYVYGFMPADGPECTIASDDFSNGATLTLSKLDAIEPADVCVIVGVLKGDKDTDIKDANVVPGAFGYKSSAEGEENYIYVLLDHIYSSVNLKYAVDADKTSGYNDLRIIQLTSVVLKTSSGASTVTANVTLKTDANSPMSCLLTPIGDTGTTSPNLLSEYVLLNSSYHDVPAYFTPGLTPMEFDIVTTYNVYDTDSNLVREGCVATNHVKIKDSTAAAGYSYTVMLNIVPTYLYQLSQPDIDNPTFVVN